MQLYYHTGFLDVSAKQIVNKKAVAPISTNWNFLDTIYQLYCTGFKLIFLVFFRYNMETHPQIP